MMRRVQTDTIKGYRGFLLDTPREGELRGVRDGALLIRWGKILDAGEFERVRRLPEAREVTWATTSASVIVPGLIDIHAHIPQYPAVARTEESLLPWLEKHIFPLEREFNASRARKLAPQFFNDLARNGITLAVLYAAIYEESCDACFEAAEAAGVRAIIGKVMMDRGSYGRLPAEKILAASIEQTRCLCAKWHGAADGRLEYAVSPRFAVTCSEELMRGAADIARETGCHIQTHLSENHGEIARVRELFPQFADYTAVYEACGLVTPKSIFGHCIHLSDDEIRRLADAGAVIAHCPTSNLFLRSGIMPMDRLRRAGLRVGLGSDVAGGPELNPWQVMRCAIESQTARVFHDETVEPPTQAGIFYLATLGGARALGREDSLGSFEPGKDADFVVLDPAAAATESPRPNFTADLSAADLLSLFIYRGGPHATVETVVRGRAVHRATASALF